MDWEARMGKSVMYGDDQVHRWPKTHFVGINIARIANCARSQL